MSGKEKIMTTQKTKTRVSTRALVMTAMLSAVSFILMFLDFSVPFMPAFIKLDVSELPALIGSFSLGPVYGAVICLIKNLINFFVRSNTGGVGELSNFLLGVMFVVPAGMIYQHKPCRCGLHGNRFLRDQYFPRLSDLLQLHG